MRALIVPVSRARFGSVGVKPPEKPLAVRADYASKAALYRSG